MNSYTPKGCKSRLYAAKELLGWFQGPFIWALVPGTPHIPLICPVKPKGPYFGTLLKWVRDQIKGP